MKVLIDTNVSLTYITGRDTDPDKESVGKFIELCMNETVEAYIAFHSVSNMWFVLTHLKDPTTGKTLWYYWSGLYIKIRQYSKMLYPILSSDLEVFGFIALVFPRA